MTGINAVVAEHESPLTFEATLQRLVTTIETAGLKVFSRIDHAANAREVGMQMPPATVLIYGNARGGTPIMLATPVAALDLPLRVLVRERDDGQTVIAFHPILAVLRQVGVAENLACRLQPAQQMLLAALSTSASG
jgi:uncharacterized protein (DUF302 family)